MARTKVVLDSGGVESVLTSAAVRAQLRPIANRVASVARSSAPVDTGDYVDSIEVEDATTDRAVVRVVAHSDHALVVEARTGNLARALGSAGG